MISHEDFDIICQKIGEGLITLNKGTVKKNSNSLEKNIGYTSIEESLTQIHKDVNTQTKVLNDLIAQTDTNQHELIQLLNDISNQRIQLSTQLENSIVSVIERGMRDFESKFPESEDIIRQWQKVSSQLELTPDLKTKLKLTIPLLFLKFEKELSWNGKDVFRQVREDIRKGINGNWTEMFLEETSNNTSIS